MDGAAGDVDLCSFQSLIAFVDVDGAAGDSEVGIAVHAVVAGADGEAAVMDGNAVVGVDRVVSRIDVKAAAVDSQVLPGLQAFGADGGVAVIGGGVVKLVPIKSHCRVEGEVSVLADGHFGAVRCGSIGRCGGEFRRLHCTVSRRFGHFRRLRCTVSCLRIAAHFGRLCAARHPSAATAAEHHRVGMIRTVFCPTTAEDGEVTAVDGQVGFGLDAVAGGGDGVGAAVNLHPALICVLSVAGLDAVLFGGEVEGAVQDADRIVAAQRVADRGDVVGAAGDHEVVISGDAVFIVAGCGECTAAVEDQIVLAEQRRVRVVIVLGIGGAVCQGVFAVRGQGDLHLIRVAHQNRAAVRAGNRYSVQHQLHLVGIARVDDDLPVGELPAQDVAAFPADGDGRAADGDAGAVRFCAVPGQGDEGGAAFIVAVIQLVVGVGIGFP